MKSPEDNSLDGLLRRSLAHDAAQEECPRADLLAAYSDHTLEEEEAARFEKHFSHCSRCRELLTAIVRLSGEAEVRKEAMHVIVEAALPARPAVPLALTAPERHAKPEKTENWRDRSAPRMARWSWLAPVAATILLVIFLYVRNRSETAPAQEMSRQFALSQSEPGLTDEKKSGPLENHVPALPPPAPAATERVPKERDDDRSAGKAKSIENLPSLGQNYAAAPAPGAGARAVAAPATSTSLKKSAPAPSNARVSQGQVSGGAGSGAAGGIVTTLPKHSGKAVPSAVPAPPAQSEAVEIQQQATGLDQLQEQSQQQQIRQQQQLTPQDQAVVAEKPRATTNTVGAPAAANTISTIIAIPTLDKKVIYRIVGAGFVEQTTDGGATWQGQLVSQNADFTAGSAPTPKICWLVGRAGAIFRTSDGSNWKKIPPPTSVDLVGVSATDASSATVTAVGGQTYSTETAGKTWVASR